MLIIVFFVFFCYYALCQAEVATAEFPVSVREFYERFFANDAPYGLPDFHMSRGDWEVLFVLAVVARISGRRLI